MTFEEALDKIVGCEIRGMVRSPSGRRGLLVDDGKREFKVWFGGYKPECQWLNVKEVDHG